MAWYPSNKEELSKLIDKYSNEKPFIKQAKIHGLIVPHAGYIYSGTIAGKAFSLLKNSDEKTAIILSPSHYLPFEGIVSHNQPSWETPLGKIKILDNNFKKIDISKEHAIDNQIPFLQKFGFKKILPLLVGKITAEQIKSIAKELSKLEGIFIFSTDLSHFLPYEQAEIIDKKTIKAIETLDANTLKKIENSACGIFPLLIFIELAKIKGWHPKLITYKNSGDITGEKSSVVGYASFSF